jgi:predicted site-specific integrase-resolvase
MKLSQKDEDLTNDLISIIHCFSARLYGLRRSNRLKIEIKKDIEKINAENI